MGLLFLSVVSAVLCWSTTNLYQCQHKAFPKQTRVTLAHRAKHVFKYRFGKESHVEVSHIG